MEQGEKDAGEISGQDVGTQFDRGGIITARGTGHGLAIRLDGRVGRDTLKTALVDFMNSRKGFLGGQEVFLEWVGLKPEEELVQDISKILQGDFGVSVRASKLRESRRTEIVRDVELPSMKNAKSQDSDDAKPMSLFDGMGALGLHEAAFDDDDIGVKKGVEERSAPSAESLLWDDPDARIIYTTLRSGQKIETEYSIVVFGDVNSGAEIVAGGDIIVLGTLRGVAHAGAYDETGGGRFIFALNLKPTQLRIGMVISRGAADGSKSPEIARVDGNIIVVEPYQVKSLANIRRT